MTDGLTDEERILAWKAAWNPSFDGIAIVEEDFSFRSVNPQFCKLLGVTPAELIGHKFQDITPLSIRKLDMENANMVKNGLIDFYILPKKYQFSSGHEVEVIMLVTRAPPTHLGELSFFVCRVMLDENGDLIKAHELETLESASHYPSQILKVVAFIAQHGKTIIGFGLAFGAAAYTFFKNIFN